MSLSAILASFLFLLTAAFVGAQPTIGMNLWDPMPHREDVQRIAREVEAMHAAGFNRVVLLPFVYADLQTGRVKADWPGDRFATMTDAELTAGIAKARQLGMAVNVTPFCEPRNRTVGRGEIRFTPATAEGRIFWDDYRAAVVHLAALAKDSGAQQFNVGSELVGLDHDAANADEWDQLIRAAADAFGHDVGYTTQHWTFDQPATVDMIWKHPRINVVSISAYLDYQPQDGHAGLCSPDDCRGHASDSSTFVDIVTRNFDDFYTKRLGPLAKQVGKPVRVGEFGIPPVDTAALKPYEWQWPKDAPADPLEAANVWRGVLAAVAKHPEVQSVDAWLWGWPGGFAGETFALRPTTQPDAAPPNAPTLAVLQAAARAAGSKGF